MGFGTVSKGRRTTEERRIVSRQVNKERLVYNGLVKIKTSFLLFGCSVWFRRSFNMVLEQYQNGFWNNRRKKDCIKTSEQGKTIVY